jgi:hypothetical protein
MLFRLRLLGVFLFRDLGLFLWRRFLFWIFSLFFGGGGLFLVRIFLLLGCLLLEILVCSGLNGRLLIWLGNISVSVSFSISSLISRSVLLVLRLICSGLSRCLRCNSWLWLDLDRGFEELVQNLVDFAVEDFASNEWVLVASSLLVLLRHDGDVINKDF